MKKALSLVLALALCLGLWACGSEPKAADSSGSGTTTAPTEPPVTVYQLGETIKTSLFEITPSFTGFASELANWPDQNYMTPAGEFSGTSPYNAGDGKVMLYGQIGIKYIGSEKSDVTLKLGLSVDFDNGYVFDGGSFGWCHALDGDWEYDPDMTFEPLSDQTDRIMRYCLEVPKQVETESGKSLLASFQVNGEDFVFDLRSGEVLGSDYDPRAEFYAEADPQVKAQIIQFLKANGLQQTGWYDRTVGIFTFTFGDTQVSATLPINSSYQYDFNGTYEVYAKTILLSWDYGEQMHLDYTFDGTTLTIVAFEHDR